MLTYNQESKPGGAGYALVFHDNIVAITGLRDFPSTEFTFEAWISSSDLCHTGAILSYAKQSEAKDVHQKAADFNHFVIFDPKNVLACHDFEVIDMIPFDPERKSCHAHYNRTPDFLALQGEFTPRTANFVESNGRWHHIAVTWQQEDGKTQIYKDGMLVATSTSDHTAPLDAHGSLVLGGEQDCFGGCTDTRQGFFGMMDEVRIWSVVRSKKEIAKYMRLTGGELINHESLTAYWRFDDLGDENFLSGGITKDASGKGNDLDLLTPPKRENATISNSRDTLVTGALKFKNSYAMNSNITNMPTKDITIEFWARAKLNYNANETYANERYAEFFSYATQSLGDNIVGNDNGFADTAFMDDAIRIERYLTEYNRSRYLHNTHISTMGAISVHINANRQGNGKEHDNWVDFPTSWTDDKWHHIAVTWRYETGEVKLYFDGEPSTAFWRAHEGIIDDQDPTVCNSRFCGVEAVIGEKTERASTGSLVLGQNQECYGGCFAPSVAYDGYMANVRVWDRVLDSSEIRGNMFQKTPNNVEGLALEYIFVEEGFKHDDERSEQVVNMRHVPGSNLKLGSITPSYQYSYAPLTDIDGRPLSDPRPGFNGYALHLTDRQVLMKENFQGFPDKAITVEFWMWSMDACREGVPFSYALGGYQDTDNAFLIFNYQDWGVSIMEDEGTIDDHNAGFSSTDGRWHHIAVTWESSTGSVVLYDNGRESWRVMRAKDKKIASGGTLVIGREQDCLGGCFDSAPGAVGDVQPVANLEYGPQDFFGVIDEVRIWKRVRTPQEVRQGMYADWSTGAGMEDSKYKIDPKDKDLVAYWKFDEGQGYVVHDVTGNGHDLHMMEEPTWKVYRWLSSCGDGLMEGIEQCDDGNRQNGDGCNDSCEVEEGWRCQPTSPSKCNEYVGPKLFAKSTKKSGHSTIGGIVVGIVCVLVVAAIAVVAYRKREAIYDQFPQVERFVLSSQSRFTNLAKRRPDYESMIALDPEADVSHGFVDSQPPAAYQPPGSAGHYTPIPDAGKEK